MEGFEQQPKPNIVLYPSPSPSHLTPMITLANFLHHYHPHFSITVLISSTNSDTTTTDTAAASTFVNFVHLPTLPLPSDFPTPNDPSYYFLYAHLQNPNLHKTLTSLPNVKALIIDFFCTCAAEIADTLRIPTYYFYSSGACGLATLLYWDFMDESWTHQRNLKDLDTYFNIPGLPPLHSKDIPMTVADRSSPARRHFVELSKRMPKSAGILVNTFDSLEPRALGAIREGKCVKTGPTPPVYCIGPLHATADRSVDLRDRHDCLSWLNAQPSRSVVFLSFGCQGFSFSPEQLREIALGLEMSGARFLWVVRTPSPGKDPRRKLAERMHPINDDKRNKSAEDAQGTTPRTLAVEAYLPEGFVERTKGSGLVVENWAPQIEVLSHDSVGGFVTHCGWNSVLEAVVAGVPMLAWPLYAEQPINKVYLVEEVKVALGLKKLEGGFVCASELAERVAELMNQESGNGKLVRERVMAMRGSALAAVSDGGSSVKELATWAGSIECS